jgi:hypothetical protein
MDIYSLEDGTVDHILDLVDAEMSAEKQPKVLLFDIGGVCVSDSASLTVNGLSLLMIAFIGQVTFPSHPGL